MDREHKKRMRTIRLIIVEIIMVISIIVLVVILTFIAMGYSVNSEGKLDQSGLVQIESVPTGGTIRIDNKRLFAKTNTSKLLSADKHEIAVHKDGYLPWNKIIDVKPGKLIKLDYVRLIKTERVMEKVRDFEKDLMIFSTAPDRNTLLYAEQGSLEWQLMNVRSDDVAVKKIDMSKLINEKTEILSVKWNNDSSRVLLKIKTMVMEPGAENVEPIETEKEKWLVLDVKNPENSLDLTSEFKFEFAIVKFASDSGDKLLVLEDGNLRSIVITDKSISTVLLPKLEWFDNDESRVFYVSAPENGEKKIGYYREGDSGIAIVKSIPAETITKTVLTKYLGYFYFGFMENNRLYVYRTENLPTPERGLDKMTKLVESDTGVMPNSFEMYNNGQFMIAGESDRLVVFDGELNDFSEFTTGNHKWFFTDKRLIQTVVDGKMVIYDFDGTNRRELSDASSYDSTITTNNRWIYYVCAEDCLTGTDMRAEIRREKLVN